MSPVPMTAIVVSDIHSTCGHSVGAIIESRPRRAAPDACLCPAFGSDDFRRIKNDAITYLENELRYASDEEFAGNAAQPSGALRVARGHP